MLAALEIPEGQIVERLNGRDGALKEMLDNVKKYSFSGYVKVGLALEGDQSEGIILFNSGDPVLALYLYKREGMGQERIYKAARAVEFLYEDSVYPEAVLSLHGRVDPEKVGRVLPSAEINRAELMPPPWIPKPFQPLDRDKLRSEKEDIAKKMIAWSKEGIDVSRLLELYLADTKKAARALPYFESNIERMRELKEKLQFMKTEGFEREAESIRRRTADPERIVEAETELAALRRRVERSDETVLAEKQIQQEMERKKQDERIDGVYDLILQYHKMSSSGVPKRTRCPTCGGPLDQSGNCPRCLGEAEQRPAFGTPLNPRFTFEKFVTGPSSRFAEAAAKAVAANPGSVYNPLFLYSRSGLGKTHLLQAVGNHAREARPELRLLCSSIEAFERELIDSLAAKKLEEFRAAYRGAELLLLDDIQFLAGKERIQEELFHTFNVVVEKGGQIVLACDRLPKEIPSVSERLITRFESGLIADIQPPDFETRLAILEKRTREEKLSVPKDVLAFVADVCRDNVRQLEGGLNRVVAFSSLMRSDITIDRAKEILSPESRGVRASQAKMEVQGGQSYLVEEDKPEISHRLFVSKLREGYNGLAITRGHPRILKGKLGGQAAEVYWLTDHESPSEQTVLPSLERIMLIIEEFVKSKDRSVVLLDDIQYLISNTTFEGIVRFVRAIVDQVSETPSIFLVSVNEESLRPQERSILEREMEVIRQR